MYARALLHVYLNFHNIKFKHVNQVFSGENLTLLMQSFVFSYNIYSRVWHNL